MILLIGMAGLSLIQSYFNISLGLCQFINYFNMGVELLEFSLCSYGYQFGLIKLSLVTVLKH
jgi:hypothetical protein